MSPSGTGSAVLTPGHETADDPAAESPGQAADQTLWRRLRWPVLLALTLVAVAVAGVLTRAGGNSRTLDPDGVSANGSRAIAALLRDRGVAVQRVATVDAAVAAGRTGGPVTVFVPIPARLPPAELRRLPAAGAVLVLIAPQTSVLAALAPQVRPAGTQPVRERPPACATPTAVLAGSAELGGQTYAGPGQAGAPAGGSIGCYPAGGGASLVLGAGGGQVTLIGTSRPFTNQALDRSGNAALAISLLDSARRVVWLLPRPAEAAAGPASSRGLLDLLPDRLLLALAQGAVALALFAAWRARRLGGVVAETLPVAVAGTETTEGRARLYRASGARASAAAALRSGAARRLATRVGLGADPSPEALVAAVGTRTARPAGDIRDLVYGSAAEPPDAAGLVRLADDLDKLSAEVSRP